MRTCMLEWEADNPHGCLAGKRARSCSKDAYRRATFVLSPLCGSLSADNYLWSEKPTDISSEAGGVWSGKWVSKFFGRREPPINWLPPPSRNLANPKPPNQATVGSGVVYGIVHGKFVWETFFLGNFYHQIYIYLKNTPKKQHCTVAARSPTGSVRKEGLSNMVHYS